MTQPVCQWQTNIDGGVGGGGGGADLLMYHCSGQISRSTESFLTVLSMIVVLLGFQYGNVG